MNAATTWVSVEGVNGVGKTHLIRALAGRFTPEQATLLAELTDASDPVPREVIDALSAGESFLRTGHPGTETLALLSLKVREYERLTAMATPPPIVIEDRGVDTVAVYQAAIWAGVDAEHHRLDELAGQITATAALWRPPPDRVLLLTDNLETCLQRYAQRTGTAADVEEQDLIRCADRLYRTRAQRDPGRWRVIDRAGLTDEAVVERMFAEIIAAAGRPR
ncbi:hypothetical protein ACWDYH_31350 [Nocardia goodfellowii]